MKSISSLWVGALWQAAMPVQSEVKSSNASQTAAEPNSQATEQAQQTINPA
ncbi:hypothetical protein [Shewanella ulleungensis]|jgi:hypothetical protein|uniref:Uncharacterized protein n=1 Tax=Shewanella ulleungensis TaxID=2282699 RepID=A0ABQ2QSZ3_9GAMM|nr:hypothetical protein [Shewanella ulleungensis]MCL1150549.1 hypothetical protein [Shewanella ulleungensis]GGP92025.1 hypothetical protein GCM10009410_27580 [Shewanella ulleungensis]